MRLLDIHLGAGSHDLIAQVEKWQKNSILVAWDLLSLVHSVNQSHVHIVSLPKIYPSIKLSVWYLPAYHPVECMWLVYNLFVLRRYLCAVSFVCLCVQLLSCVRLFVAPWTVAHQVSLFMGFYRQESWGGLPFPTPGDLPNSGIEPTSPASPALAGRFVLYHHAIWEGLLFPVWHLTRGHRPLGTSSLERLVFTAAALIFGDSSPQDRGDTLVMSLDVWRRASIMYTDSQNCSGLLLYF